MAGRKSRKSHTFATALNRVSNQLLNKWNSRVNDLGFYRTWHDYYLKACQVTVRHDAVSCLKQCLILLILLKKLCLKTQKAKNIVKANVQLCSLKAKRLPRVLHFEFSPSNFGTNLGTNTRLFTFHCYYYHPFVPFILNYEPGQSLHANKVKSFDF